MTSNLIIVNEEELDQVLAGQLGPNTPWRHAYGQMRIPTKNYGVLIKDPDLSNGFPRPCAVITTEEDQRKLFGRYSQLRGDLSPISAWCHIIGSRDVDFSGDAVRFPDLGGFQAAWIGLCVAEALLLSERPIRQIKLAACLATKTFALARTKSLWQRISLQDASERYDTTQKLLRTSDSRSSPKARALEPIWEVLWAATLPGKVAIKRSLRGPLDAITALRRAREIGRNERIAIGEALGVQFELMLNLDGLTPEHRVREFDRILRLIDSLPEDEDGERDALLFLAGYIATVAAGGAPSLGLAEDVSAKWPQVSAWAYVIGSVGERVTWTSGFDGLGRLVDRELARPLRLDEPPMCDFALEEALVLVDRALSDPLVHLKVKQLRVLTVAMYPGVNVALSLPEAGQEQRPRERNNSAPRTERPTGADLGQVLVDIIWPALEAKIASASRQPTGGYKKTTRGKPRKDLLSSTDDDT